MTSSTRIR
jgi:hypothetical protein